MEPKTVDREEKVKRLIIKLSKDSGCSHESINSITVEQLDNLPLDDFKLLVMHCRPVIGLPEITEENRHLMAECFLANDYDPFFEDDYLKIFI